MTWILTPALTCVVTCMAILLKRCVELTGCDDYGPGACFDVRGDAQRDHLLSTGFPPHHGTLEYRSRLGEVVPMWLGDDVLVLRMPVVALAITAASTSVALARGCACRYSAATPAACGAAMDVPLRRQ